MIPHLGGEKERLCPLSAIRLLLNGIPGHKGGFRRLWRPGSIGHVLAH